MKNNLFAEIPVSVNEPTLEFLSNREASVEGSRGVLSYSEELIRINLEKMTLSFHGRNLNLKSISASALIISGFIMQVNFDC